jgi:hypothetical protein
MANPLEHLRGVSFPRRERKEVLRQLRVLEAATWTQHRRMDHLTDSVVTLLLTQLPRETLNAVRATLGLLEPWTAQGVRKVRVGNPAGDGGYVMLDAFHGVRRAYSLGVGDDMSWDVDMARRHVLVEQFDGSLKKPPERAEGVTFRPTWVRARSRGDEPSSNLPEVLRQAGDLERRDLVLKLDIEGDEWDLLADAGPDVLACFGQIVVELHDLDRIHLEHARYRRALEALAQGHAVVHLHANACAPFVGLPPLRFPTVLEATFARRAELTLVPNRESYPTPEDRANHPSRPDMPLALEAFTPRAAT